MGWEHYCYITFKYRTTFQFHDHLQQELWNTDAAHNLYLYLLPYIKDMFMTM